MDEDVRDFAQTHIGILSKYPKYVIEQGKDFRHLQNKAALRFKFPKTTIPSSLSLYTYILRYLSIKAKNDLEVHTLAKIIEYKREAESQLAIELNGPANPLAILDKTLPDDERKQTMPEVFEGITFRT